MEYLKFITAIIISVIVFWLFFSGMKSFIQYIVDRMSEDDIDRYCEDSNCPIFNYRKKVKKDNQQDEVNSIRKNII